MCRLICACLLMTVLIAPASAGESEKGSAAWDGFTLTEAPGDRIHALFSPYSYHYSRDPEHRHVWLVGTERERANGALAGAVLFSNSFGQPTIYAYPWGGYSQTMRDMVAQQEAALSEAEKRPERSRWLKNSQPVKEKEKLAPR